MRKDAYDYLLAEHNQLLEDYCHLLDQYRALLPETRSRLFASLRAHRLLLANHRLARQWSLSEPTLRPAR
jgi:hypothetical protein